MMKVMTLAQRRVSTDSSTGRLLCCAATAAAFGTLPGSCAAAFTGAPGAFPAASTISSLSPYRSAFVAPSVLPDSRFCTPTGSALVSTTERARLLSSSRRNYDYDPDEEESKKSKLKGKTDIVSKAKDTVKSFLPKNWFKSDEEKEAAIERKRRKNEITGGIDEALKGAPLGLRMMGKMVAPLLSKAVSGIAETVQEQNRRMEGMMDDARRLIVADGAASDALGEPIVVGNPFSQSSSSANINGRVSVNIQASFEVMGSDRSGVATVVADGDTIRSLQLVVEGRSYDVDVSGRGQGGGGRRTSLKSGGSGRSTNPVSSGKGGNVIDAEIIDAEFTEKK